MVLELCSCFVYFVPWSWGCCLVAKCFSFLTYTKPFSRSFGKLDIKPQVSGILDSLLTTEIQCSPHTHTQSVFPVIDVSVA